MKSQRKLSISLLLMIALLAFFTATNAFAGQCDAAKETADSSLVSNDSYEVVASNEVKFRPGVEFEIVKNSEGREMVRFGQNLSDPFTVVIIGALECRCKYPDVCTRNTCATDSTGGTAHCNGGCYRADGTPCVSCAFEAVPAEPLPK